MSRDSLKFQQLKELWNIKESFYGKRHKERIDLVNLRFNLTKTLINLKDNVAIKRFNEKIALMENRIKKLI